MIDLRAILAGLYADRSYDEMEVFLSDYGLMEPLKRTVSQLNEIIKNQEELRKQLAVLPVGHIGSNLLVRINETIAKEKDIGKKKLLESSISSICLEILKSFISKVEYDMLKVLLQIEHGIKDTCIFYNYDYNQLNVFFNLRATVAYQYSLRNSEVYTTASSEKIPHYVWNGKAMQREEFIQMLKHQNLILSKKGFHHLFDSPAIKLNIHFNADKADITLQLFHNLKQKKILSFGNCSGFYKVLEYHVPDFRETFLKNKDAKSRINALKQNTRKWSKHQGDIENWLKKFS